MIIVARPDKPFDLTGKLQPRRPVVVKTYQSEIDAAYQVAEEYSETKAIS